MTSTTNSQIDKVELFLKQNKNFEQLCKRLDAEIIVEHNKFRADPQSFIPDLEEMVKYFDGKLYKTPIPNMPKVMTQEGDVPVKEAIEFLKNIKPLPELEYSLSLTLAARDHARDCGKNGLVGH